jgi:hypothetical protein
MTSEKIQHYFDKYPDLRVLFFFDPNRDYENSISLHLPEGIDFVKYTTNDFTLKLHFRTNTNPTLLYLPIAAPGTPEAYSQFGLADLLVANKVLQLDDVSGLMETFGLQPHQRGLVEQYRQELQHTTTQKVLRDLLIPERFDEPTLIRGLLSVYLKFTQAEEWPIVLVRLFNLANSDKVEEFRRVSAKISTYNWLDTISQQTRRWIGLALDRFETDELARLAQRLKYNAIVPTSETQTGTVDPYRQLWLTDYRVQQQLRQWIELLKSHPKIQPDWTQLLTETAADIQEEKLVNAYGPLAPYPIMTQALSWSILSVLSSEIGTQPVMVLSALEPIKADTSSANPLLQQAADLLRWCARFFDALNHINGFTLDSPDEYIQQYVTRWYQVDMAYRKAVTIAKAIDETDLPATFPAADIRVTLNKYYHPFLEQANREWLRCLNANGFDYSLLKTPKSYDFFSREIGEPTQKIAVLISDGLRYEVAAELLDSLNTDSKTAADIQYQLASLPSKTNVGMADLLPGRTARYDYTAESVLVDGLPTSSLEQRQQVLQRALSDVRTINFDEIESNSQEQNRELFKSRLVYIYHNLIDTTGDKKVSERQTFQAAENTVIALRKAIRKVHSSFNVAKIIITADHGFLYTDQPVPEKDLQKATGLPGLITHNRFELVTTAKTAESTYSFPLRQASRLQDNYYVVIPESVNRFRKQGAGHQYVHGGGSLQELVVPVLVSARRKEEISQRVTPMLINRSSLRVVSNLLKVMLLQEPKVSTLYKARTIVAGLYQDFDLVSSREERVLNATSDIPNERSMTLTLTLLLPSSTHLRLRIFDKEDTSELNPLVDELVRNDTLIQAEF